MGDGRKRSSGGSFAKVLAHASYMMNSLSLVQGCFSYILVQIVALYSVNQMFLAYLIYLSKLCGIKHFFIISECLIWRNYFKEDRIIWLYRGKRHGTLSSVIMTRNKIRPIFKISWKYSHNHLKIFKCSWVLC